ncbi:hypothetical protein OKW29_008112 [Paraburkholderia sp. CI3]
MERQLCRRRIRSKKRERRPVGIEDVHRIPCRCSGRRLAHAGDVGERALSPFAHTPRLSRRCIRLGFGRAEPTRFRKLRRLSSQACRWANFTDHNSTAAGRPCNPSRATARRDNVVEKPPACVDRPDQSLVAGKRNGGRGHSVESAKISARGNQTAKQMGHVTKPLCDEMSNLSVALPRAIYSEQ